MPRQPRALYCTVLYCRARPAAIYYLLSISINRRTFVASWLRGSVPLIIIMQSKKTYHLNPAVVCCCSEKRMDLPTQDQAMQSVLSRLQAD